MSSDRNEDAIFQAKDYGKPTIYIHWGPGMEGETVFFHDGIWGQGFFHTVDFGGQDFFGSMIFEAGTFFDQFSVEIENTNTSFGGESTSF